MEATLPDESHVKLDESPGGNSNSSNSSDDEAYLDYGVIQSSRMHRITKSQNQRPDEKSPPASGFLPSDSPSTRRPRRNTMFLGNHRGTEDGEPEAEHIKFKHVEIHANMPEKKPDTWKELWQAIKPSYDAQYSLLSVIKLLYLYLNRISLSKEGWLRVGSTTSFLSFSFFH